jgi:hypothetical protein
MHSRDVGYGILSILAGVTVRYLVVVIVTHSNKYTLKERLFMGITWIGKATVEATLSGLLLAGVNGNAGPDMKALYTGYGTIVQNTAILSVLICAPIGAICQNSFGTILLTKDIVVEAKDPDKKNRSIKVDLVEDG